jgi:hypothetical protein
MSDKLQASTTADKLQASTTANSNTYILEYKYSLTRSKLEAEEHL